MTLIVSGQFMTAGANQSVESLSALTTEEDVVSNVDQGEAIREETVQVNHDPGSFTDGGEASPLNEDSGNETQGSTNPLPAVGYVPKQARRDGQFSLVAESASETDQLFQKSALSESKKLYEAALKAAQRVLLIEPEHPGALLARGRLLVKTHQYSAAKTSLEAITSSRTDDWRPWFWLGTANLMLDELVEAELAFDESLARNADVAESWLHRALVAQQRGNWQVALQLLSIANEIAPDHPLVMLNVAMCREVLGYQDEAANGYRKFLSQSHRTDVSKLLRFEVINHLTTDSVAANIPEVAQELDAVDRREVSENAEIVVDNFNEIPISSVPNRHRDTQ